MSSSNHYKSVVGIIGGIGPEATNYFTSLLVKLRRKKARKDQDHIPYIVFNNPQIPDRTRHLVYGRKSPVPELIHSANVLKMAGVSYLAMPCNTSHAYTEEIEQSVGLPVLSMIEVTVKKIKELYGENCIVGLLATDGTLKTQIYQSEIRKFAPQMRVLIPDERNQQNVMDGIYGIKSAGVNATNTDLLQKAAGDLVREGANVIILGCTEIPLALTEENCEFKIIDPMVVLAEEIIDRTLQSEIDVQLVKTPLMPVVGVVGGNKYAK